MLMLRLVKLMNLQRSLPNPRTVYMVDIDCAAPGIALHSKGVPCRYNLMRLCLTTPSVCSRDSLDMCKIGAVAASNL